MSLAALASIILAICKAVPAAAQLAEMVGAQLAAARQTAADAQTDADLKAVASTLWICPRVCPHRGLYNAKQPAAPSGSA